MIYILRHGLDDERFIGGWSNVSLIEEGIKQVEDASGFLKESNFNIEKIVSSDILRAKETSLIVQKYLDKEIVYDEILRELNKGKLNGLLKTNVPSEYDYLKGNPDIDVVYPDGESLEMFFNRIKRDLNKILSYDNSLLITHRGVINALYFILNDIKPDNNKERFNVTHASIHELDPVNLTIRKIY